LFEAFVFFFLVLDILTHGHQGWRAETTCGRGTNTPAVFIVLDEKGPFFVLSSPRIDHLAAGGRGSLSCIFMT
jgi:hypothetical protein